MALGDPYITAAELAVYVGIGDTVDDATLQHVVDAVSRGIDGYCGRQFQQTTTASARRYRPASRWLVDAVDEFHTATGLIVKTDDDDDGTFETTWASTDFELAPIDGVVGGVAGWPFNEIVAVESRSFPCTRRTSVEVTAQWGWAAVPSDVVEAAYIQGNRVFKRRGSPEGVAGFGEFGVVRVVRLDPDVQAMLNTYNRNIAVVA